MPAATADGDRENTAGPEGGGLGAVGSGMVQRPGVLLVILLVAVVLLIVVYFASALGGLLLSGNR